MPSVYITGPKGNEGLSNDRVIQGGDFLSIDWGVCLMNFCTDVKRQAYVLKAGEIAPPPGHLNAYAQAMKVREVIKRTAKQARLVNVNDLESLRQYAAGEHS